MSESALSGRTLSGSALSGRALSGSALSGSALVESTLCGLQSLTHTYKRQHSTKTNLLIHNQCQTYTEAAQNQNSKKYSDLGSRDQAVNRSVLCKPIGQAQLKEGRIKPEHKKET